MAVPSEEKQYHLQELVRFLCKHIRLSSACLLTVCYAVQQKEVEFLHNENHLLEGYLQRVRA